MGVRKLGFQISFKTDFDFLGPSTNSLKVAFVFLFVANTKSGNPDWRLLTATWALASWPLQCPTAAYCLAGTSRTPTNKIRTQS